jgi:hypothetical protein
MKTVEKPRRIYEEPAESVEYIELGELRQWIDDHPPGEFKPTPFYNRDGDMIEVYFEDADAYGDVTFSKEFVVMRAQGDGRIVGIKIHRVKALLGLVDITNVKGSP